MIAILVLLPFAILELGLRVLGIGGSIVYVEDPNCGYRPKPSQKFSTLGYPIEILDNGYRGPVRQSDTLFIGDSVTYGCAFIRDEDTFAALLKGMNAGVNGWGIQNVAQFLKKTKLVGVKRVVLTVPSCDVLRPFITLRNGLISTNRRMYLRIEYLFRFIWYGKIRTEPAPIIPTEYDKNLAAILEVNQLLKSKGVEFVTVFLPYRDEAEGKTVIETPYVARMIDALRKQGIRCIQCMPTSNVPALYRDAAHLSPEGHRWFAECLRKQLQIGDTR